MCIFFSCHAGLNIVALKGGVQVLAHVLEALHGGLQKLVVEQGAYFGIATGQVHFAYLIRLLQRAFFQLDQVLTIPREKRDFGIRVRDIGYVAHGWGAFSDE